MAKQKLSLKPDKYKIFKKIAGIVLIVIGVIGLFLPIIQGVLLIIAGLLLLGVKKEQMMKWVRKFKKKIKDLIRY